MAEYINSLSITGIAAALCHAMNAQAPEQAAPPIQSLENLVFDRTHGKGADRLFMYNPDAIGLWLYQKYTEKFDPVLRHTQLNIPLCTVMPSVTPVCFGSLYTGAQPEAHGIRRYEKPVIRIDTVFDALIRAGKRIAVLADTTSSIAKIFLERDMDYFIYDTIEEIDSKAQELIEEDKHDVIVVYHANYDSTMHKNGTEADVSLQALDKNIAAFDAFCRAIKAHWQQHNTLVGFAMDHGCHDIDGGCGSHGLDMAEDLNIMHFYGVFPQE